jgi:hypothetical protein
MKIAVLGWGSLMWNPNSLEEHLSGAFEREGRSCHSNFLGFPRMDGIRAIKSNVATCLAPFFHDWLHLFDSHDGNVFLGFLRGIIGFDL